MSTLKLVMYGLLSEQSALLAIFGAQPVWQRVVLFLTAHLIASSLFSLLLTINFPKRFVTIRRGLLGLFFCFNFFVPAFGAAGTLLILLYFRKFLQNEERAEFSTVPLPPFLAESLGLGAGMGEGGAWSRLRTVGLPREQRLKALLSVGTGGGGNASRLLQHATGDSDDEIRLLAFNLCERQEQKIQQAITAGLETLKTADSPELKASVCRNLAFSYWEMVYSALAQDDLRNFFVEQAAKYAEQSRLYGGEDPSLYILVARIHLQKREYALVEAAIQSALAAGADPLKVVPYQAELAFNARDFKSVRRFLMQDATIRFRPCIGEVAQFWGAR
jgi:polysaccharide biosynthesis protein PelE